MEFAVIREIKYDKRNVTHQGIFLKTVRRREASSLNSDGFQGHLSADLAHLANISYYIGENNKVSIREAKSFIVLSKSYGFCHYESDSSG